MSFQPPSSISFASFGMGSGSYFMFYLGLISLALLGVTYLMLLAMSKSSKPSAPWLHTLYEVGHSLRRFKSNLELCFAHLSYPVRSLEYRKACILTKTQVEQKYAPNTWQRQGYQDFTSILLAKEYGMKTFPCIYATMGYKGDEQYYCFLHSEDPSNPRNVRLIADALIEYLPRVKALGFANTTLVIMAPRGGEKNNNKKKTVEDYTQSFWNCLKALRHLDPEPWPAEVPQDMSHERWTYCFNGHPSFMVVMTPAHDKRLTRYAPNFCIVFQPKWIFDFLFTSEAKREAVCKRVRDLIAQYDEVPLSPDLTHFGTPGSSEVRQYCLMDENVPSGCPFEQFSE